VLIMTENPSVPATTKPENVTRGSLFALGAIPIAIVAFAIFGYVDIFPFIVGIATPFVAGWLYRLGSGGTLTRAGWVPFIVISMVAVLLGAFAAAVASVFRLFGFGTQFANALGINLRNFQPGGQGFFIALGLVLGVVGIVITLRQVAATPAQQIAANTAQWTPPPADPATATPPPAAPAAAPPADLPSPSPEALEGRPTHESPDPEKR
jgi:hypothetical protein